MFDFFKPRRKSTSRHRATDRRAERVPHVNNGMEPRARNLNGRWRGKRADVGTKRGPRKMGLFGF